MISVVIRRNKKKRICGFAIYDHGSTDVCAAVSLLTLNTVNSIEELTKEPFEREHNPEGGFLKLNLPRIEKGRNNKDVNLLLESMTLGLVMLKKNYSSDIEIEDDKYD